MTVLFILFGQVREIVFSPHHSRVGDTYRVPGVALTGVCLFFSVDAPAQYDKEKLVVLGVVYALSCNKIF